MDCGPWGLVGHRHYLGADAPGEVLATDIWEKDKLDDVRSFYASAEFKALGRGAPAPPSRDYHLGGSRLARLLIPWAFLALGRRSQHVGIVSVTSPRRVA